MKSCILIVPAAFLGLFLVSCGGLLLEEPPGTENVEISGIQATAITTVSATITWSTNVPTTHIVEYGISSGNYSESTLQSQTADTAHSVDLTGLSEGTTYYYRANNYSLSLADASSGEYSFTTAATPPPTPEQRLRGIWIIGGLSTSSIGSVIGAVDLFDPVLNTWYASVTTLPTPVSFAAASSSNGNLYVIGGFDSGGNVLSAVQIYDVAGGGWSAGTGMPAARANTYAATVNGRIYVLGGTTLNAATNPYTASNTTWEYTPGGTWSTKATMAASYSERLLLPFNDVIYHLGGRTAATTVSNAHDGIAVTINGLTGATEVALSSARTGGAAALYAPASGPALMAIVGGFTSLTATSGNFVAQGTTASSPTNLFQYLYYPFTSPASWQGPANYPLTIGFGAAAIYGSRMYVFGGTSLVTAAANGLNNACWFDLSNLGGAWTVAASLPAGRYGHCAVAVRQ
jgi:N-acetylneuraminic acid mutarotase